MQVGALTAFLSYLMQILMSVMMATFMLMMMPRAAVCAERIAEVLDTDIIRRARPPSRHRPARARRDLEFGDAAFTYPGAEAPVLRDIVFRGPSRPDHGRHRLDRRRQATLLNLVPRLFDATRGTVLVDGVDVRDLEPEHAVVPDRAGAAEGVPVHRHRRQQPALRQGGRHRGRDVGRRSRSPRPATSSRPCPRVSRPRSPRAAPTSRGGQRQRLAIARALVRQPEIYLFDDSFSALDLATDARLRAALSPVTRDATVLIVVAQRVSTIRDADQILVLEDGAVVGRGTHDELLDACPTYQEIVASQLSAEEAA